MPFKFFDVAPSYDTAEVFYVRIDPEILLSEELLRALYYLLWFPGYFGFNWDALYDCLRDLAWIPCRKVVLVHEAVPGLPREDLKIYLEVLRDAVLDWKEDEKHQLEVFFKISDRNTVESLLAS
ncbi:barstar family protein [Pseudomonas sp.]|uniref:barstar family protein n=1 Tax=Pseudomonas sp. TaxID=306 RepID=UPI00290B4F7B|nr:barstar family protein [Pseudomonas sp.]MDU4250646.1 barstar family protein [Pseudomonas sp.]